ncbi:DUF4145 domain-containing protein [Cellulomonas sp. ES6]|uniref:DUF4145 domain-containing protein n=1 Tax=Cellulomonas sp. ES6 TaxID=3039384 RepID=UPI0024B70F23|nr:DUF4145 domain-containing protein [Cellulomonas sp. ES6]WHP18822.1 DUF4145 domain-containing protein [Cellulomonas sp. ES6]
MASRVCWNCATDAHQTLLLDPVTERTSSRSPQRNYAWFGVFQCDQCGFVSIGMSSYGHGSVNLAHHARARMDIPDAMLQWLPEHVLGRRFDDVPEWIADAASEAYACYSIRSYRAAILLARSVVEAVAKDKGIAKGQLADKIDALADAGHIRALIQASAHEIRHLGNEMAHGDFVEPTTAEDAEDVLDFMSVVLAEVYQLPAQVNARQATRVARKAAAEARKTDAAAGA